MAFNKTSNMYEGYIYCITNKINNKKYIGQTRVGIRQRMNQHFSYNKKQDTAIDRAIKKYGRDCFDVQEIEKITSSITINNRKYTGFNILSKDTLEIFSIVSSRKYLINGISNKNIKTIILTQKLLKKI